MSLQTHWYYKPTNSPRYNGAPRPRDAFLTDIKLFPGAGMSRHLSRSPDQQRQWLQKIGRHTQASASKHEFPRLCFSYDNRYQTWDGRYQWHKMDFFKDAKKSLWTPLGEVKSSFTK